jgi:peptide/nickel transport system permease protein
METLQYMLRKLLYGIPLILGVTMISFILMVEFGPDKTYELIGKNATHEQIAEIRHQLGYDQPFLTRYGEFIKQLVTFDFGHSDSSGELVGTILKRTIPVTVILAVPGFVLGNLLGIILALWAGYRRGSFLDKGIMAFAVIGMSISFVIVIIVFQFYFCSSFGLNLFPVTGWDTSSIGSYLHYVTVPTMCSVFVALGYNTRFYRAIFVEEMTRDHVRTAKAFGASTFSLLFKSVLKNSLIPIITRIIFTLPFIVIGGSLLIESYFGIPGIGQVTYDAITSGDLPILKSVVSLTAILYVMVLTVVDLFYRAVDPRITVK